MGEEMRIITLCMSSSLTVKLMFLQRILRIITLCMSSSLTVKLMFLQRILRIMANFQCNFSVSGMLPVAALKSDR